MELGVSPSTQCTLSRPSSNCSVLKQVQVSGKEIIHTNFLMDGLPNFFIHFYRSTAGAKKHAKIRTVHAKEKQTIAPWSVNV